MKQPRQIINFTPVPVRARRDGWTVEKQFAFIQALAETGVVEEACRQVGMSRTSADNLRARPCGVPFRRAWEAALDYSLNLVEEGVFARARKGVARPIFYKGEQVGEYRHFDERLTMFLLRTRRPYRYGRWVDHALPPIPEDEDGGTLADDPGIVLDSALDGIEFSACDVPADGEDAAERRSDFARNRHDHHRIHGCYSEIDWT